MLRRALGSGKSSLLTVAAEQAATAGLRVLEARGVELEQGFAFGAIRRRRLRDVPAEASG